MCRAAEASLKIPNVGHNATALSHELEVWLEIKIIAKIDRQ